MLGLPAPYRTPGRYCLTIAHIRFKLNIKELKQPSIIYFTAFRDLIPNKATSINTELANKGFMHLITAINSITNLLSPN